MKIKCVSNIDMFGEISDYLTIGKVYNMEPYDEYNDAGELIDDNGDTNFEFLIDPSHGQWEIFEEMKKVIYIAGKITGDGDYKIKFAHAERKARKVFGDVAVLNPAGLPDGMTEKQYMAICLAMVSVSDAVLALPDWCESEGAKVEVAYAEKIGIEVYYD